MSFDYSKLWSLVRKEGINKTQLRDSIGISNDCLSKLSKNEKVSMNTLAKLCKKFNCDIGDIVEYINEED